MADIPTTVDDLYGLAPSEFVAARDALAKQLRDAGDRERAAAVKKLRRPSATAAALNLAARAHPDLLRDALHATARLRAVTEGAVGGRGGDVRAATADERAATKRFLDVAEAQPGVGAAVDRQRLAATLRAAALDEALAESLRRGVLAADHDSSGFDFASGFSAAGAPGATARPTSARRRAPRGRAGTADTADEVAAQRAAQAERRRELEANVAGLRATATRLGAAADKAEAAARSARAAADGAAADLDKATRKVKRMR